MPRNDIERIKKAEGDALEAIEKAHQDADAMSREAKAAAAEFLQKKREEAADTLALEKKETEQEALAEAELIADAGRLKVRRIEEQVDRHLKEAVEYIVEQVSGVANAVSGRDEGSHDRRA